ncbi:MAG: FAD-binding oxidoreductase [Candidatus Bathyarchaeia archaeon]
MEERPIVLDTGAFLEELSKIVGPENVVCDPKVLAEYAKDHSFVKPTQPLCIVYPNNKDEIKQIVHLAGKCKVPIVPVSSGPPHFRGDTVPREGGIIIDLSRLKKVLKIDLRNRAVLVEPGVTFGELVPVLEKHGLRLNMPLLPRASKSVVTAFLEREPPIIPKYQFDYVDPLLTMEIIFGTGDEFRTGTASGPGSIEEINADMVNPFGPGDIKYFKLISGSQGSLGIVTWAMVKAEVMPKLRKLYFIAFGRGEDIIEPLNRLQRYGVMGSVADELLALNSFNLALILAEKWPEEFDVLRKKILPWVIIVGIGGYKLAEERIRVQEKCLMDVAQELGFEPTPYLPGAPGKEKVLMDLLSRPWDKEPYWKIRYKGSCCELFFLAPPSRAALLIKGLYEAVAEYGFSAMEVGGYVQPLSQGHAYHIEVDVPYNPSEREEVDKVQSFFTGACEKLVKMGAFFSRPYGSLAEIVYRNYDPNAITILRKIKNIFDPDNILNPGVLHVI